MKYSSLVLGYLLILTGCNSDGGTSRASRVIDPVAEGPVHQPEVSTSSLKIVATKKIELLHDFSNYEDFKAHLNTYVLHIEAKSGHFVGAKIVCAKTSFDQSKNAVESWFDARGLTAKLEFSLQPTDPNFVDLECVVKDKKEMLEKEFVRLRKSIIVSGKQNAFALGLGNGEEIETLAFEENSTLITDGAPFFQKASTLISRGGKLVTFDSEKKYTLLDNQDGLSGGNIFLETKKAMGILFVKLIGLDGGKQMKVPERITTIPAADPRLNGSCSKVGSYSGDEKKCFGKNGHQGYEGKKGLTGLNGGNSGSFKFKSTAENKLKFIVDYFPGKGSSGGMGGEGGQGGPGGIGSIVSEPHDSDHRGCIRCFKLRSFYANSYKYPNGSQGPKGVSGIPGDSGTSGEIEDSSIEMLWEELLFEFNYNWKNF